MEAVLLAPSVKALLRGLRLLECQRQAPAPRPLYPKLVQLRHGLFRPRPLALIYVLPLRSELILYIRPVGSQPVGLFCERFYGKLRNEGFRPEFLHSLEEVQTMFGL